MRDSVAKPARLNSLDQFRGYTVLGMFLVNFVGSFIVIGESLPLLKHYHTYFSYADSIMPQFFFAVGFAYRMTFLRRAQKSGKAAAYRHAIKRNLWLLVIALIIHRLDGNYSSWAAVREMGWRGFFATAFQREFFQTLTHIAVTSLWVMPVIAARPGWRIAYAIGSAGLFYGLSEWQYYYWVMHRPGIDGGPLGFLTWTTPIIVGTLAYDAMATYLRARESESISSSPSSASGGKRTFSSRPPILKLLIFGALLMLVGYGLSCLNRVTAPNQFSAGSGASAILVEPPFVPPTRPVNIWTMSQRAGSVTYLTFGAGFSLAVYALFVAMCDVGPLRIGLLRTLGTTALAGYILEELVNSAIEPFVPRDSPLWYIFAALGVSITLCYLILRRLEKSNDPARVLSA